MDDRYSRATFNEEIFGANASHGHEAPAFAACSLMPTSYHELQNALHAFTWYVTFGLE